MPPESTQVAGEPYERACKAGQLEVGQLLVHDTGRPTLPRFIIFPTKRHWREKSEYAFIESGLEALTAEVRRRNLRSIALPALGCGLGGLEWSHVRVLIETAFRELPEVEARVYEPADTA